ncbi:MAG: ribosomal protein L7/L12 [Solirubrobacterales bacterium]
MAEARELLEIKQRIALIESRLQQLFEHLDVKPRESSGGDGWWGGSGGEPPDLADDPEIQDLLAKGNKIQAIKRYRELTGAGLKEAKDAIDRARG